MLYVAQASDPTPTDPPAEAPFAFVQFPVIQSKAALQRGANTGNIPGQSLYNCTSACALVPLASSTTGSPLRFKASVRVALNGSVWPFQRLQKSAVRSASDVARTGTMFALQVTVALVPVAATCRDASADGSFAILVPGVPMIAPSGAGGSGFARFC